jgi:hypothetical protein
VPQALDDFAIACTWIFGIVGLAASATTVNGFRSRPHVTARWTTDLTLEDEPPWEGLVVDVRSRQRPVRIERLEIEMKYGERRGLRGRASTHHLELATYPNTPCVLQDADVLTVRYDTDHAVDDAHDAIGEARIGAQSTLLVHWGKNHVLRVAI